MSCTKALFDESKSLLNQNNFLMLCGLFIREKIQTTESSINFDRFLKLNNPQWVLGN